MKKCSNCDAVLTGEYPKFEIADSPSDPMRPACRACWDKWEHDRGCQLEAIPGRTIKT